MRLAHLGAAIAIAGLAAAGCEGPAARNTVVVGVASGVSALLPAVESTTLDASINSLLYLSLNSARWKDGAIEYLIDDLSLAERWEFDPDSTTLTYELRPGLVWSDGEPIDAADVVFTYELLRAPGVASRYSVFWEELDSVVALDDRRVTFHFRRRHPRMLLHSGMGIMPAHIFGAVPATLEALAGHPSVTAPGGALVVSGPFRVAEWRPGEVLVLEPNPRSFAVQPKLDRVVFRVIPDEATRVIELRNGAVDVIDPAPLRQARELAAEPGLRVETTGFRYYDFIAWNGVHYKPFADPDVRRALSYAIDREAILSGLGIKDFATPASGPYSPLFPDLLEASLRPDPFLPDSAATILHAKGWRDSDGDGTLDKAGAPFRFVLLTQSDNERRASAAQVVQVQLAAIGIDVDLRPFERNALIDRVFRRKDFESALVGWSVTLDPNQHLDQFWPTDAMYNITRYESPAVDTLIAHARAATTAPAALPYWRAAGVEIARDRPYAFLWFFTEVVALRDRVKGVRIDAYGVYQNLHEWTVEP